MTLSLAYPRVLGPNQQDKCPTSVEVITQYEKSARPTDVCIRLIKLY